MPGATTPSTRGFSDLVNLGVAQAFLDTYWENRIVDNVLLEHIKKFGKVRLSNNIGKFAEWTARVAKYDSAYRGRGERRNFAAKQLRVAYAAAYSRLETTAVFYEEDIQDLQDQRAVHDWLNRELTDMSDDFMIDLNERLLAKHTQDSNTIFSVAQDTAMASGDPGLISVLDIFSYGATAYQYIPGSATGTTDMSSTVVEVLPNATYCGVSTHPDATLSGVNGTRIIEATSPVIVNAHSTSSLVTTSSTIVGWSLNATGLLDYAVMRCRRGNKASMRPSLGICTGGDLAALKRLIGETITQQVVITEKEHVELNSGLLAREYVPYASLKMVEDQDCPSGVRYVLHPSQFELVARPRKLLSTGKPIIKGKTDAWFNVEQQYDIDEGGQKVVGCMQAQCWANPFHQGIITDYDVV
jgi:hypothetical protein